MRAMMLDLETMATDAGAIISSIGGVVFDPHTDWIGDSIHIHVSMSDCMRHGLNFDVDTFLWWMQQSDDARLTLVRGQLAGVPVPLSVALRQFADFFRHNTPGGEIWCNGPSFDFPILKAAYRAVNSEPPWDYQLERDLRTLKSFNKGCRIARTGTHHNALDDARHQARLVQHILQTNSDMDS